MAANLENRWVAFFVGPFVVEDLVVFEVSSVATHGQECTTQLSVASTFLSRLFAALTLYPWQGRPVQPATCAGCRVGDETPGAGGIPGAYRPSTDLGHASTSRQVWEFRQLFVSDFAAWLDYDITALE